MCLGHPMQILTIEGTAAICSHNGTRHEVDLSLVEGAKIDDWVLVFLGAARRVLSFEEAKEIGDALDGLHAAFDGHNVDEFFADIIDKGPQLPPHLQQAFENGLKSA